MATLQAIQVMTAIFEDDAKGEIAADILFRIGLFPPDAFRQALSRLDTFEAVGPLFEPTAFCQPRAFESLREWRQLIEALGGVRAAIARYE